ncbi:putative flavo protein monooxygenase [Diaporthe ampelina]|uniref:Putative flavo protein monooxygenase n=1 Tax=Diaporthe ampelina TaxID=1214573 RepID=A0A0G2FTW3_9PEZI|nr:putative flavo protein monooxygenase [Diaporthe ampelina]
MAQGQARKPFRAIIVGGGLVGLTAAHVFEKAGLDYVILEKHGEMAAWIGSLLTIWPQTFRIFDQLGLLDTAIRNSDEIEQSTTIAAVDASFRRTDREMPQLVKENHGHGIRVLHRPVLVDCLYDTLSDAAKARIHLTKHVTSLSVTEDGASVTCSDGTVEHGTIIIGADGVYSKVRQCMQDLQSTALPGSVPPSQRRSPYTTTYRMYFGNTPVIPGLPRLQNWEGDGEGYSTQLLMGSTRSWFALYEKLDGGPMKERTRYTEADKQALLDKWGHIFLAPGKTLKDVYALRSGAVGLINLEEGLVEKWHWRRVVLMGDAVRKLEPHAGLGYNVGVTDIVVLANKLQQFVSSAGGVTCAAEEERLLDALFAGYQEERMAHMPAIIDLSMRRARVAAWLTWQDRFMAKYVLPSVVVNKLMVKHLLGPLIAKMPVLGWLEETALPPTRIPNSIHT